MTFYNPNSCVAQNSMKPHKIMRGRKMKKCFT